MLVHSMRNSQVLETTEIYTECHIVFRVKTNDINNEGKVNDINNEESVKNRIAIEGRNPGEVSH